MVGKNKYESYYHESSCCCCFTWDTRPPKCNEHRPVGRCAGAHLDGRCPIGGHTFLCVSSRLSASVTHKKKLRLYYYRYECSYSLLTAVRFATLHQPILQPTIRARFPRPAQKNKVSSAQGTHTGTVLAGFVTQRLLPSKNQGTDQRRHCCECGGGKKPSRRVYRNVYYAQNP